MNLKAALLGRVPRFLRYVSQQQARTTRRPILGFELHQAGDRFAAILERSEHVYAIAGRLLPVHDVTLDAKAPGGRWDLIEFLRPREGAMIR